MNDPPHSTHTAVELAGAAAQTRLVALLPVVEATVAFVTEDDPSKAHIDAMARAVDAMPWPALHPAAPAVHVYLSAACWHALEDGQDNLHRYCQTNAVRHDGTEKVAATCKFCPTGCICPCHKVPASGRNDGSSDGEPPADPGHV